MPRSPQELYELTSLIWYDLKKKTFLVSGFRNILNNSFSLPGGALCSLIAFLVKIEFGDITKNSKFCLPQHVQMCEMPSNCIIDI